MSGRIDAGDAEYLDEALGWLLESRHVPMEVVEHFWHIADGSACDCEETGLVQARESSGSGSGAER